MQDHDDGYFDERMAAIYDELSAERFAPAVLDPTVDFLADLADGGSALEFASGTGRVALPLASRGVRVRGIDISVAMTEVMRSKSGASSVDVTIGDFATTEVDGVFDVVYLVFNTIMNLTTQAAQVACFRNAANHLRRGGYFVVEVSVPKLQSLPQGETVRPFKVEDDRLGFDEYDVAEQGLISHHFRLADGVWERFSVPFRYVWPAELDLMSQLAGMEIHERWSSWDRQAFTSDSANLIAVWRKP